MFNVKYIFLAALLVAVFFSRAALAADTCDRMDTLVTTTPAPPANADRWEMHTRELSSIPRGNADLVVLGDSLAELWPAQLWEPRRVVNLGVGGDDTQRTLWRLSSPRLKKLRPRHVLIVLGTNNLGFNKACAITEGLKQVIKRTAIVWPGARIAFLEIPPKGAQFIDKNDDRMDVNRSIRGMRGIKTINVDDAITCHWKEPCANYGEDHVHFTDAGYRVLQNAVEPAIFGK